MNVTNQLFYDEKTTLAKVDGEGIAADLIRPLCTGGGATVTFAPITDADFFSGDVQGAAALQLKLLALMNQLMIETNPIPAKAACAAMGFGQNLLRLPLVQMEEGNRQKLLQLMRELGLEVAE